jgi:hypothetical protein
VLGRVRPQTLDEVPVRVHQRKSSVRQQILSRQRFDERGLSHARLADDVDMHQAVGLLDAE